MGNNLLLVGDFGGTNARLAVSKNNGLTSVEEYKCADFDGPGAIIKFYTETLGKKPDHAIIAVASPADDPTAITFTNGPWKQKPIDFSNFPSVPKIHVMNDFEANCYSVAALKRDDCESLVLGKAPFFPSSVLSGANAPPISSSRRIIAAPQHRFIVVGPGTGLGVGSGFLTDDGCFGVLGGEGGHALFAPTTEKELAVKKHMEQKQGIEVTNETFASGTGLKISFNAYHRSINKSDFEIKDAAEIIPLTNSSDGKIRDAAFWSLRTFARTLGSCASAAALTTGAQTIFMGGGVINKLGSYFDQLAFTEALRKNDLGENNILRQTPVVMIKHPYPGLLGALAYDKLS